MPKIQKKYVTKAIRDARFNELIQRRNRMLELPYTITFEVTFWRKFRFWWKFRFIRDLRTIYWIIKLRLVRKK